MRMRSSREFLTDGSAKQAGKKMDAAATTKVVRANNWAPSDVELSEQEVETPFEQMTTGRLNSALPVRSKKLSVNAPASGLATALNDTNAKAANEDPRVEPKSDDEIVSELVTLVLDAGLPSHHHLPLRAYILENSAIFENVSCRKKKVLIRKVMRLVRAEVAVAEPSHDEHDDRILPGWPKDIIPALTELVRNAALPALDYNCVGAYVRKVSKGNPRATLDKWTRLVMQNLQQSVGKGKFVKDGCDRTSAIEWSSEEEIDRVGELHAASKKRKIVHLTDDDDDDHFANDRHAQKDPSAVKNRKLSESPDFQSDRSSSKEASLSPPKKKAKNSPTHAMRYQKREAKAELKLARAQLRSANRKKYAFMKANMSNIGEGEVMFTYLEAKARLENPPKNNIKYDMKTGEHLTYPITRSYHLGAMGRY